MKGKLSVVTISFNNYDGLIATSKSISSQTLTDFEWLIVDGGSSDLSLGFLKSLQSPCSSWISEPDDGIYHAMNKGVMLSRSEYIIFMNAGDRFSDKHVLSNIEKMLAEFTPDIIYGDAVETDGRGYYYKAARSPAYNAYSMFTHHQSIVYRAALLKEVLYDQSYKYSGDWALTTRLLRKHKASVRKYPGAICLFERGGISQRDEQRRVINAEHLRILVEEAGIPLPFAMILRFVKIKVNSFRSRFPNIYNLIRFKESGAKS